MATTPRYTSSRAAPARTCGTPPATSCSTGCRACSPCRSATVAPTSRPPGALSGTGTPAWRAPFEPLTPGAVHVANTNRRRHALGDDEKAFMLAVTDEIEDRILFEGPESVAAVFVEPVQNAGGCLVPP